MRFIFITNVPDTAVHALASGVDRLMVDLEIHGKVERQGHLSTVISRHTFDDLAAIREAAPRADIMVRLNPVHEGTSTEINQAVALGASIVMLPMFSDAETVRRFSGMVAGRLPICLLVETVGSMDALGEIVRIPGIDEIHIGLNDLHLELGNTFMFEPMANGLVDRMADIIRDAGLPFGVGGIARIGEGLLPAEIVLAEHARLGSSAAILSRTFHRNLPNRQAIMDEMDFANEVAKLRACYSTYQQASPEILSSLHADLAVRVRTIVDAKHALATS
jgi:2-keto-3-deoxy-L-rhamnonate aldolase RhmA